MPQRPSHSHQNSIDDNPWLAGFFIAVFVFLGSFVLSLRYHISTLQWVEGGVYIILLLASIWLLFAWRRLDRNREREPFRMPLDQDELEVERAADQGAVLFGYTLDKAPVIWTNRTRAMQALLCGMNGSGKTTMLENIVSQDLTRMVGRPGKRRHLPMVIFDGKGDAKFFDKLLPHIHRAGRMDQLRIIAPSRPEICARYNPFFAPDGRYMERVNMVFGSFSMRRDFFTKHQFDYLSNIVRILYYTIRGEPYAGRGCGVDRPQSTARHAMQLNALHLAFLRTGKLREWLPETEICSRNILADRAFAKDYDAVLSIEHVGELPLTFALEYEYSQKPESGYQEIATRLNREQHVDFVLYVVPTAYLYGKLAATFRHCSQPVAICLASDLCQKVFDAGVVLATEGWRMTLQELIEIRYAVKRGRTEAPLARARA